MEYITTKDAAAKWGISTSRITILANEGRIPGAQRLGRSWLIPANATKPSKLIANHSKSNKKDVTNEKKVKELKKERDMKEIDNFSFPLYHFRPDYKSLKKAQLTKQQQSLLLAEAAILECHFADAYLLLESILRAPKDIVTEIGCLWNAGICCIALNKPDDFSKIYLRLQMLLSKDFPHRNDLMIILDALNTYVETVVSASKSTTINLDVHDQCLPMVCLLTGYMHLSKEAMKIGAADTNLLEFNLRF